VPGGPACHAVFVPQFGSLPGWLPSIGIIAPLGLSLKLFQNACHHI
jgi:hypothetical protein